MGARRRRSILIMPREERKKGVRETTEPGSFFKATLPRWGVVKKKRPVLITRVKSVCGILVEPNQRSLRQRQSI